MNKPRRPKPIGKGIWHRRTPTGCTPGKNGRLTVHYETEDAPVAILVRYGQYLMVRRHGGMPFVLSEKDLTISEIRYRESDMGNPITP